MSHVLVSSLQVLLMMPKKHSNCNPIPPWHLCEQGAYCNFSQWPIAPRLLNFNHVTFQMNLEIWLWMSCFSLLLQNSRVPPKPLRGSSLSLHSGSTAGWWATACSSFHKMFIHCLDECEIDFYCSPSVVFWEVTNSYFMIIVEVKECSLYSLGNNLGSVNGLSKCSFLCTFIFAYVLRLWTET